MSAIEGIFMGKGIDYAWGTSPEKGTRYAKMRFRITRGEHEGAIVGGEFYITAKTQERFMESMVACGCDFPDDDFTNLVGFDRNEVELVVGIERWNDKKTGEPREKSRINFINGAGGGMPEEQRLDGQAKASFAQQMKGALKAFKQKRPASPNVNGNGRNPDADDAPW